MAPAMTEGVPVLVTLKWADVDAILALWPTLPLDPLGGRLSQSLREKLARAWGQVPRRPLERRPIELSRSELELLLVGCSTTASRYATAQDAAAVERWFELLNDMRAVWLDSAPVR